MANIPHQILSDHYQNLMEGRKLIAAVFLTFRFDPAFFEREVLPVFMDIPLSHATEIKLVQLEDALRAIPEGIAVYYDQNGLSADTGPAKLDIKRIPIRHRTGIFHPKNVFVLLEDDADEQGYSSRMLLIGCQSANLTRAGWWENVEVCHTEVIREGGATRLRDDLLALLLGIERRMPGDLSVDSHTPLHAMRNFLRKTQQRSVRSSDEFLYPHFYNGQNSVSNFLQSVTGNTLQGMNLEVISPYFNQSGVSAPLKKLAEYFSPREVRVMLPVNDSGEALCPEELYSWVNSRGNTFWGKLPDSLLTSGSGAGVKKRFVHAKVYRFFSKKPKREVLFIGSVNLTTAAHELGGNQETGFLVEIDTPIRPDWWLKTEKNRPAAFVQDSEDEGTARDSGTRLRLRFNWNSEEAEAFWDEGSRGGRHQAPPLTIEHLNIRLFDIPSITCKTWIQLPLESARALQEKLISTSIFQVKGDRSTPVPILVQEEGMSHKPSLLFTLSPADILRYWSLLTIEQRASFLANHAPATALTGDDAALVSRYVPLAEQLTLFDRFAGIFHAFGSLERSIVEALASNREKEAIYRLFGKKYDSLGNLLDRIDKENATGDLIESYVITLCAQQLIAEIKKRYKTFWGAHEVDAQQLAKKLLLVDKFRTRIIDKDPINMPAFLTWFEGWFLKRAEALEQEVKG